jgi:hypothetical protein
LEKPAEGMQMKSFLFPVAVVLLNAGSTSCLGWMTDHPGAGEGGPPIHGRTPGSTIVISDFVFPWSQSPAPGTRFRAHIADGKLHFEFDCTDTDIVVASEWRGESTLDLEDRVEIFFAREAALESYYCLEVDPLGRVHDYAASHYRKFDSAWDFAGLRTRGQIAADGYCVSGSIPLQTLSTALGKEIGPGKTIRMGLFRAEFHGTGATARGEADDNWMSWVRPTAESPDFHVPSAFQDVELPTARTTVSSPACDQTRGTCRKGYPGMWLQARKSCRGRRRMMLWPKFRTTAGRRS